VTTNLLFKAPHVYFSIMGGNTSSENWSFYDINTGYPPTEMFRRGGGTFAVCRFMSPFMLLSFNYLSIGLIILDCFAFIGIWKFYLMLCKLYPGNDKIMAFPVLFVPSLVFWGSGIMKDTFVFSSTLWLVVNIHRIFLERKNMISNTVLMAFNIFIILTLKAYVLVALIPCLGLSIGHMQVERIRNRFVAAILAPMIIIIGLIVGAMALSFLSSSMGSYSSVDNILTKAQINQKDLIRTEQYGTNSFNIGEFEPTIGGMLSKAPQAIMAGLFRPYLWEARNPVMLITGLENTAILLLFLYILFKLGRKDTLRHLRKDHYLLFCFMFSMMFAFMVGLTTGNFGALVRYKIPGIPFFLTGLVVLWLRMTESKKEKEKEYYEGRRKTPGRA
jgi:hypothetical protein